MDHLLGSSATGIGNWFLQSVLSTTDLQSDQNNVGMFFFFFPPNYPLQNRSICAAFIWECVDLSAEIDSNHQQPRILADEEAA